MSWVVTFGILFGKTFAKSLIKTFLDESLLGDLLKAGVDESADQITDSLNKISAESVIQKMAQRLKPVFDSEKGGLDKEAQQRVVLSLSETFSDIDSKFLIKLNLNPDQLRKDLLEKHPEVTKDLSSAEESFYLRLLSETCKSIVTLAPKMEAFEYEWSSEILRDNDRLLALVEKMSKIPNEADKEYENLYLEMVAGELDKVDFLGLGKVDEITHRQSLSVSYVSLQVKYKSQEYESISNKQSAKNLRNRVAHNYTDNKDDSSSDVAQVFSNGTRFVIRGEAGAGKTTLMHWLAVRAAKKDFSQILSHWNNLIPFVIHLREYSNLEDAFPMPEQFPLEVAKLISSRMPGDWVNRQLDAQRSLVLIDGVDELPIEKRKKMLRRLQQLVKYYPLNHYVITSRPTALRKEEWQEWDDWVTDEKFMELSFQQMDIHQIESFISQWHDALSLAHIDSRENANSLSLNLKRIVNRRSDLQKLAENPLLCAMLCALHHDRRDSLPSDRRQLYRECIELLLDRRDIKRGINLGVSLNLESKTKVLRYLAYWMMDNQDARIDITTCDERINQKLKSLSKASGIKSEDLRRYFIERANLLREPVLGSIEFVHRSFQEYLASQYAVLDERNFGALAKNSIDEQWQDVIILSIGEISNRADLDNFLERLLNLSLSIESVQERRRLQLVMIVGLEQASEIPSLDIENAIMEEVKKIIPPKSDEIDLFAAAGDRGVSLLHYKDDYTNEDFSNCIKAISKTGSNLAVEILEDYNSKNNEFIRTELCNSWDSFDLEEYATKVLLNNHVFSRNVPLNTLDGFRYLRNLSEIKFVLTKKVKDIKPLEEQKNLKKLSLVWDNLFNVNQLITLPELEELQVNLWFDSIALHANTNMLNVDSINEFSKLKHLQVLSSRLKGVKSLAALKNLEKFNLLASVSDIDFIEDLPKLTELAIGVVAAPELGYDVRISSSGVESLSFFPDFKKLKNLKKLSLGIADNLHRRVKITNISRLSDLTQVTSLMLSGLDIENIDLISDLGDLEELYLYQMNLKDLSVLSRLKNIKKFYIEELKVENLEVVKNWEHLSELSIKKCPINDLKPIEEVPSLRKLVIEEVPAEPLRKDFSSIDYTFKEFRPSIAPLIENIQWVVEHHPELSAAEKEDITVELSAISDALFKVEIDEIFLARRFRNIERMAPFIAIVALQILKNPIGGVSDTIKRIELNLKHTDKK
jgi:predicted NACHT family NTPase